MNSLPRDIQVRLATAGDIAEMARTRATDPSVRPADSRMAAYREGRHHPHQALAPRAFYVAEAGGVLAGYIAGHLTRRYGCEGEVQYLYVALAQRRTGVAGALLQSLAQWFVGQGATRVCVDVDAESPGAAPFYQRHGAQPLRPHWLVWPDIAAVIGPATRR